MQNEKVQQTKVVMGGAHVFGVDQRQRQRQRRRQTKIFHHTNPFLVFIFSLLFIYYPLFRLLIFSVFFPHAS